MLEAADVHARLEMLQGGDLSHRVFGASEHRYQLVPPWSEERTRTFEARHAVRFPDDYRHFLTRVGSRGAGPGFGLYEPGTWGEEPRRWENSAQVAPLATPFPHTRAWNLDKERLARLSADPDDDVLAPEYWSPAIAAGTMPVASLGAGVVVRLVVTGAERGRIWIDDRAGFNGLHPESGYDFEAWYRAWLDGAERIVLTPPARRTTGRRGTRPPHTLELEGAAAAAAERLRERVHASLAAGHTVDLGGLGRFLAGPHPHFEQGLELRDALIVRAPPKGAGDAHDVFAAVFQLVATGAAVSVPGLLTAWRAPAATWELHDYLGRRQVVEEPALLVIAVDDALPRSA